MQVLKKMKLLNTNSGGYGWEEERVIGKGVIIAVNFYCMCLLLALALADGYCWLGVMLALTPTRVLTCPNLFCIFFFAGSCCLP